MGAFALEAEDLIERYGLPVLPVRDKGPLITQFTNWRRPPSVDTVRKWRERWSDAQLGVLTGKVSNIVVIDVDDPTLLDGMLQRFGDTPVIVATARGRHLYYAWSGEGCPTNLRREEKLPVDVRGQGGFVLVPPSIGSNGDAYRFLRGGWHCLPGLSSIKPGALRPSSTNSAGASRATPLRNVGEGQRNDTLFTALLHHAPYCDDEAALLDVAETFNADFEPPLSKDEVIKTVASAWRYQQQGQNWVGQRARVVVPGEVVDYLLAPDPRRGPDALALYLKLQAEHGARDRRGEPFYIAARAMAGTVMPWPEGRIRAATKLLLNVGLLERVHAGGRGEGDAARYRFRSLPPNLGVGIQYGCNKTPAPLDVMPPPVAGGRRSSKMIAA